MSQIVEPLAVVEIPPSNNSRRVLHWVAAWSVVACVAIAAFLGGLTLRRYAWDQTKPIHFQLDINNAFRQGSAAVDQGYLDRYDERLSLPDPLKQQGLDLDYGPGRLGIATLWVSWLRQHDHWSLKEVSASDSFYQRALWLERSTHDRELLYEVMRPLLALNTTGELLSAIAMFLLVQRYTAGKVPNRRPLRGLVLGTLAALLFWFNPAIIWNAHCWPQWDTWVTPFYLWALVLASWDCWFCAGAAIAAGAMFKGQTLFAAPFFLLWPLFQARLLAILRWIIGLFTALAVITSPWMLRTPGIRPDGRTYLPGSINYSALHWIIWLAAVFAILLLIRLFAWMWHARMSHRPDWSENGASWKKSILQRMSIAVAAACLIVCPLLVWAWHVSYPNQRGLLAAGAGIGILAAILPLRHLPFAAAAWMAAGLFSCIPIFGATHGWYDLGIAYGTYHFEDVARGGEPNNLPNLLETDWEWTKLTDTAATIPKGKIADAVAWIIVHVAASPKDINPEFEHAKHLTVKDVQNADGSTNVTLKYLMTTTWLTSVALCCIGAAIHDRARSPRFLITISTPWIIFFAVMTQMHQRYLLWGASLSASAAVLSPGFAFLHLFLTWIAATQEMHTMMNYGGWSGNTLNQIVERYHPGIAWAVLLTAGIFLYSSLKIDRPKVQKIAESTV